MLSITDRRLIMERRRKLERLIKRNRLLNDVPGKRRHVKLSAGMATQYRPTPPPV
jgi:hypothetical protein